MLAFVYHAGKTKKPLINISVFKRSRFTFSVLYLIMIQFICLGIGFLIPNYAQLVMGDNAFTAGCILLPGCIIGAALNPFTGKLLDHRGAALPILIGTGSALISSLLFAVFITVADTVSLMGIYIFFAVAQGFTVGNIMTNGLRSLPAQLNADGNAIFSTFQQLAGAMGTSVSATIVAAAQQQLPGDIVSGTRIGVQNAFILLLVMTIIMAVFAGKAVINRKKKRKDAD